MVSVDSGQESTRAVTASDRRAEALCVPRCPGFAATVAVIDVSAGSQSVLSSSSVPFSGVIFTRPSDLPEVSERSSVVSDSGSEEMSPYDKSKEASKQLNMSTMLDGGTRSWREGVNSSGRPIGR